MSGEQTTEDPFHQDVITAEFNRNVSGAEESADGQSDGQRTDFAPTLEGKGLDDDFDLSAEFNQRASSESSRSDSGESSAGDATGRSETGQASAAGQVSVTGGESELPDYAKSTYRTADDAGDDAAQSASHGFTPGL